MQQKDHRQDPQFEKELLFLQSDLALAISSLKERMGVDTHTATIYWIMDQLAYLRMEQRSNIYTINMQSAYKFN